MEFREKQSIYMQIANYFASHILEGTWAADEKVPSVRQLAVDLEVNPNTVFRAYAYLQDTGVIFNKRGLGFYVGENARDILRNMMKERFFQEELPETFKTMRLLEIDSDEINSMYKSWLSNQA
jgi:GntR family transcriptional regulator